MAVKYDANQQAFTLAHVIDEAHNVSILAVDPSAQCKKFMLDYLGRITQQIGHWDIIWGPRVIRQQLIPANAMAVLTNGTTIMVAVSSTNPESLYDWFIEDGDVSSTIPWHHGGAPDGALLSKGTAIGLKTLLAMTDPATNTTLGEFLKGMPHSKRSLIFTGYSLGAALAPVLAAALYNSSTALDRAAWERVSVNMVAGATPGNAIFAEFFAKEFPVAITGPKPWQAWNRNTWNTLDVVPHAWEVDTMSMLPRLYGTHFEEVEFLVGHLLSKLHKAKIAYQRLPNQSIAGTLNGKVSWFYQYIEQMAFQHTSAYYTLLDVADLPPLVRGVMSEDEAKADAARIAESVKTLT